MNTSYKMNIFIQLFLFKSTIFAFLPFFFALVSGYSNIKTYEDLYLSTYKIIYTNIDLLFYLILEQPIPIFLKKSYLLKKLPLIFKEQRERFNYLSKDFPLASLCYSSQCYSMLHTYLWRLSHW